MKDFKKRVESLPQQFFSDIDDVMIKHGYSDLKITDIKFMPNNQASMKECADQGKILKCNTTPNGNVYCRCVLPPQTI